MQSCYCCKWKETRGFPHISCNNAALFARLLSLFISQCLKRNDLPGQIPRLSRIPECVWFASESGPFAELDYFRRISNVNSRPSRRPSGVRVNIDLSLGYGLRSVSVHVFPLASGSTFHKLPNPFPLSLLRATTLRILLSNLSEKQLTLSIYMQIRST